jgi:hypothetical protein
MLTLPERPCAIFPSAISAMPEGNGLGDETLIGRGCWIHRLRGADSGEESDRKNEQGMGFSRVCSLSG